MSLNIQSISYIDNREFPGNDDVPPGPLGYQWFIHNQAISIVPNIMFILNSWLAAGFLVTSAQNLATYVSNVDRSLRSIVAALSIP